jgi:UDP-N-acetylmuramate: L-alanyl-gamma-D-glutamyl-meso-diaminopimelate ligase
MDHLKSAFRRLMEIIPPDGQLLVCSDYTAAMEVAVPARCPLLTYGDDARSDWTVAAVEMREGRSSFEPCYKGRTEGRVDAAVIGKHNVKNALAVYAMGRAMGFAREKLLDGFATFAGVKRRQEVKGEKRGVLVIDDFAHHPTAVRETIQAVKDAYPGRRLWAIFEPRSNTSRRNIFAREFAHALAIADRVVVAGLYQPEKIPEGQRLSVAKVVEEVNLSTRDSRARVIDKAEDIAEYVASNAARGDILLVMSNGGFDGVQEKILRALESNMPGTGA